MAADKIYYYIQINALEDIKHELLEQSHDEVKVTLEQIVNIIVWTKENYLRDGISCLHYVAKKGRTHILKEMLHHEGIGKLRLDIDVPSAILWWSPLHYAAYSGHVSILKLLIRRLAYVDARAKDNKTPLHIAVQRGLRYIVASLVCNDASLNVQDDAGMTPLHYAVDKNTIALNECTSRHTREIVDFLIRKGADACISNKDGDTPLHCALKADVDVTIIKLLALQLKNSNVLGKENRRGFSPAHLCKSQQALKALLSLGASVDGLAADGRSLLHIHSDNFETANYLINQKADKTARDKQGRIPLHSAMTHSCPCLETVKLFGGEYNFINAVDKNGMTPLHLVSLNGYTKANVKNNQGLICEQNVSETSDPILEYLIANGADLDAQNNNGQTALHLSLKQKHFAKAKLLISHGASLDITDQRNISPRKMNPNWARNCFNSQNDKRSHTKPFLSARQASVGNKPPLPKWVTTANIQTDFNDGKQSPDTLSRELTLLQDDVTGVKKFLEDFSKEGGGQNQNEVKKEVKELQGEVRSLKRMLDKASS